MRRTPLTTTPRRQPGRIPGRGAVRAEREARVVGVVVVARGQVRDHVTRRRGARHVHGVVGRRREGERRRVVVDVDDRDDDVGGAGQRAG